MHVRWFAQSLLATATKNQGERGTERKREKKREREQRARLIKIVAATARLARDTVRLEPRWNRALAAVDAFTLNARSSRVSRGGGRGAAGGGRRGNSGYRGRGFSF